MAQNLFNTELLKSYSGNYTEGYGEWVLRNGIWAMRLGPAPIYYTQENHLGLKNGEFKTNTRYLFDLWIDADDLLYEDVNRWGGLTFAYTDDYESIFNHNYIVIGDHTNPLGFQHIRGITEVNRSIYGICPYYWTSTPIYYRFDSSITEYTESDIKKTGIIETGIYKEDSDTIEISKGGIINSSNIKEI